MNTVGGEPDAAVFMDSGLRRNDERNSALARFQEAQAILDSARSEPDEEAYDALLDSHSEALTPSSPSPPPISPPSPPSSTRSSRNGLGVTGSEGCLEILRQDAHRLATTAG